jgi:hypothetical protein
VQDLTQVLEVQLAIGVFKRVEDSAPVRAEPLDVRPIRKEITRLLDGDGLVKAPRLAYTTRAGSDATKTLYSPGW